VGWVGPETQPWSLDVLAGWAMTPPAATVRPSTIAAIAAERRRDGMWRGREKCGLPAVSPRAIRARRA